MKYGRRPQYFLELKTTSIFVKWKTTSILLEATEGDNLLYLDHIETATFTVKDDHIWLQTCRLLHQVPGEVLDRLPSYTLLVRGSVGIGACAV